MPGYVLAAANGLSGGHAPGSNMTSLLPHLGGLSPSLSPRLAASLYDGMAGAGDAAAIAAAAAANGRSNCGSPTRAGIGIASVEALRLKAKEHAAEAGVSAS